ncbi:hypothetical protein EDD22DRAFT_1014251 [Suillus occidentalis]|nr:hypothetical protein EDD22DRAFT_1014251 [Suillus occidentalis]
MSTPRYKFRPLNNQAQGILPNQKIPGALPTTPADSTLTAADDTPELAPIEVARTENPALWTVQSFDNAIQASSPWHGPRAPKEMTPELVSVGYTNVISNKSIEDVDELLNSTLPPAPRVAGPNSESDESDDDSHPWITGHQRARPPTLESGELQASPTKSWMWTPSMLSLLLGTQQKQQQMLVTLILGRLEQASDAIWAAEAQIERKYEKKIHELTRKLEREPQPTKMSKGDSTSKDAHLKHVKVLVDKVVKPSTRTRAKSEMPRAMQLVHQGTKKARKKKKGKSSKKRKHTILKPVPPMVYDEEVDTEVARDPYRWRLPEFFTELFNHCFPVNFQTELHAKLKHCYQNDKTVRAYFYELSDIDECQRVEYLWFGMKPDIQQELWKKELNPKVSSFNQVLAAVEVIEISLSVPVGRDRKGKKGITNLESSLVTLDKGRKDKGRRKNNSRRPKSKDQRPKDKGRPKPWEGDKPQGSSNKWFEPLQKEEHHRLAAEGKCFHCKQPGHQSRHCPERNNVKGGSPCYKLGWVSCRWFKREPSFAKDVSDK